MGLTCDPLALSLVRRLASLASLSSAVSGASRSLARCQSLTSLDSLSPAVSVASIFMKCNYAISTHAHKEDSALFVYKTIEISGQDITMNDHYFNVHCGKSLHTTACYGSDQLAAQFCSVY